MSTITKGTAKPKKRVKNAGTRTILINITQKQLNTFKELNSYHKSLNTHDIMASMINGQLSVLGDEGLRTLSFWYERVDKPREGKLMKYELTVSVMRYKLIFTVSKLVNKSVEWVVENLMLDAEEYDGSYLGVLTNKESKSFDIANAKDVISEFGKNTLIYLAEEQNKQFAKDRGLTIWEQLSLEHIQPA